MITSLIDVPDDLRQGGVGQDAARAHGLELQRKVLKFWSKADISGSLLEKCDCAPHSPGPGGASNTAGLCLKGSEEFCFRLYQGEVSVKLKQKGAQIVSEPGTAIYMSKKWGEGIDVKISDLSDAQSHYKALHAYQGKEQLIQNIFTNTKDEPIAVSFGTTYSGDVVPIPMHPGDEYYVRAGSYVCGTSNIRVTFERSLHETLAGTNGEPFLQR